MKELVYRVSFPKLGINLNVNPIALKIGNLSIHWYGVIIAVGFLLAFFYTLSRRREFYLSRENVETLTLSASICAIIFARIYYIVFYPGDFYLRNPSKMLCINEGGIAIYGAIIGGFLAILVTSKIIKKPLFSILDLMCLGLLIGQSIGRWGNFVNQEAFGTSTTLPWGMMSENTFGEMVHPCFLYESLGCLVCFIFLHIYSLKFKFFSGQIFLMYMALYGILRALIEGIRTDSLLIPGTSLRISQILGLLIFFASFIILTTKLLKKRL